jgi:alpha/beta hydrolase family protein
MDRRSFLQGLGATGIVSALPVLSGTTGQAQTSLQYEVHGAGPTLVVFKRDPNGYYDRLADKYRIIVLDYAQDPSRANVESFTAERVCADILSVLDTVGVDRFAWFGFSWGGVVGLQLAVRTSRLTALVIGGWPPLGGQYRETLAYAESRAGQNPLDDRFLTYYRSLRNWAEREAVSNIRCPRMAFAGTQDQFVPGPPGSPAIRIGPLIREHREELERMGWTVRLIEGFGHELGGKPDVVVPVIREFLDPILLRA